MEGFYKFDGENWLFTPNFVYAKDYRLEKEGNREEIDVLYNGNFINPIWNGTNFIEIRVYN